MCYLLWIIHSIALLSRYWTQDFFKTSHQAKAGPRRPNRSTTSSYRERPTIHLDRYFDVSTSIRSYLHNFIRVFLHSDIRSDSTIVVHAEKRKLHVWYKLATFNVPSKDIDLLFLGSHRGTALFSVQVAFHIDTPLLWTGRDTRFRERLWIDS
jgi:hypothetical protein